MHTVFLYVCTLIIWSFVHSGRIVADREMFDISAILHFCVSNKKKFFDLLWLLLCRGKTRCCGSGELQGGGREARRRPLVQNKLYNQVTRHDQQACWGSLGESHRQCTLALGPNKQAAAELDHNKIYTKTVFILPVMRKSQVRALAKAMVRRDECTHTCLQKTGSHFDTNKWATDRIPERPG